MPTVLYLHGFLSSPKSTKALVTQEWLHKHYPDWVCYCPQISSAPHLAHQELLNIYQDMNEPPFVIGSSLGGFWANWCVEKFGGKAVLVNPAVAPHTRFQHFVGEPLKSYYSDDVYILNAQDLDVLECCDLVPHNPQDYLVMLQSGDQTLDYRMALKRYCDAQVLLESGGSHSFVGYEQHLARIMAFFQGPQFPA